jgi:hypothetical protein
VRLTAFYAISAGFNLSSDRIGTPLLDATKVKRKWKSEIGKLKIGKIEIGKIEIKELVTRNRILLDLNTCFLLT